MRFYADLHVHSKYSRATSRDLDLEHLAWWAARKGIAVVGTGDCAHPVWLAELKSKLVPAAPGLFRLRADIEAEIAGKLPASCRSSVHFMLSVEISTIYKKGDRTRKIHHLIYAPDFDSVDRLAAKLARIGNIASDGRPILGLDSRDLLEIKLESSPDAYLVPAHIWTPWFAALGSQSGFDSIAECYGDLADHIFAVETGLSSDPGMNWRVSFLDRYRLTSNSDAHSPAKLGREATLFECAPDYFAMRHALETGAGYVGTIEFFPEEGKYHMDGHRRCGVRFTPQETLAHGGRCPVCGEPVTIGVAHRVEVLADRSEAEPTPPSTAGKVANLVPLSEVLAELAGSGPSSKTVTQSYNRLLAALGPELSILADAPVEHIARSSSPLLAEAITRLRAGTVIRDAGYDGEYGVIRLFEEAELKQMRAGALLFDAPLTKRQKSEPKKTHFTPEEQQPIAKSTQPVDARRVRNESATDILTSLDKDQYEAAATLQGPLLIVAGPGSGKTRTLTHRVAHLLACGVPAEHCLAITFTRRAAAEMRDRLAHMLTADVGNVSIHTFHSLGLAILKEHGTEAGLSPGFRIAGDAERAALLAQTLAISERKAASFLRKISRCKRTRQPADNETIPVMTAHGRLLAERNWIDFDDLVRLPVDALARDKSLAALYRDRFRFVSVDEFQDVDEQQYRLLTLLAPPDGNLCAIGDPNQAIYGFRGADASCFERFRADYPTATAVHLRRNYRSTGTIVAASAQVIAAVRDGPIAEIVRDMHERIAVHTASTDRAEAEFVVATIENLIGGHSFFSIDSGRAGASRSHLSFSDFAVLYRTDAQSSALCHALSRSGMPYKTSSSAPLMDKAAVRALLIEIETDVRDVALPVLISAAAERLQGQAGGPDTGSLTEALRWLKELAQTSGQGRTRFIEAVRLATEADFWDPRADRVSLLTMHAAKGLEFPIVFVVGLEDGLMPLRWGDLEEATVAEERRLFYVAMTRAKDHLFLSRATERHWRGSLKRLDASPFLADIETELLKQHRTQLPHKRPEGTQLQLL